MNKCPKCGFNGLAEERFCKLCGTKLVKNTSSNNDIDSNSLEEIYVGENYDKIIKKDISPWVLLFGAYYILYRKMWLFGILFIIISNLIIIIFGSYYMLFLIIFDFYVAWNFNKLYLKFVNNKIAKLKERYFNKSEGELKEIARKKGGTSWIGPIIIFILCIMFICFLFWLFGNYSSIDNEGSIKTVLNTVWK